MHEEISNNEGLAGGMVLRPASERGQANFGWLNSFHTFSFGSYRDPKHMQFRNLRVINDDEVAPGQGFGEHPHQDAEIFSYVLEGALEHKDSMGNGSVVTAGGVQYMSAGTGVTHSEFNPSTENRVRFLQIWLLPNVTGQAPRYDTLQIDKSEKNGQLKLFLSPDGRDRSIRINADANVYAATLSSDQAAEFTLADGRNAWVQVAGGSLLVNGQPLEQGDGLAITEAGRLNMSNGDEAEILLFDLPGE